MSELRRLAVVGSRTCTDTQRVVDAIKEIFHEYDPSFGLIVSGGAKGVDSIASGWADANGIKKLIITPDYDKYPPKIAPLIRNEDIVKNCDVLLAIWDGRSGGTANAIAWAAYHQKRIHVVHSGY